ncbi:hypothetical protein GQX74_011998 [Glossina fuscipes]|nr:hypothetical protein GQX74_011998 [Glossina fuscipes]
MSGQYPGGYNNAISGHRGQFNAQQQQQQQQQQMMNQLQMGGQQQGIGPGVMNPVGMQSPSHVQQQLMQQQQIQMQQQQQQMGPQMGMVNQPGLSPQQPHKEINIVALSRVGQETVQDITSRFQEIFTALKVIQPTANRDNSTVKKVQEHFRTIRLLFKRMRLIYERCNDGYPQGMEYTTVESLIPFKDEPEHRLGLEATQCEEYRKALQENQELIDTVKLKNRQLREIIDRTRIIVWEINTMLSMRKS